MISVILYGRNDSYGYNLHKRGVLSLNCIAEVLDDPDDEILFVDYNTPDDLPTFIEAIADMLTPKARNLVRTLRVRPDQHARFGSKTHLRCLESPARNVALRRSNPRNRWILSTNTDMVFMPRSDKSVSAIAAELPDGFYHTARFEIPEVLWETLDRSNPRACIDSVRNWGKRLQLNEVSYGFPQTIFDGPGDFQLFLREDGFKISGFDERMLLGWHVDTNTAIRLAFLRGKPVEPVLDQIFAYHCDHTRETTPAHAHGAPQNSWQEFITNVTSYELPEQRNSWGFAGDDIEVVPLSDAPSIEKALESVIPSMGDSLYVSGITNPRDIRYDPEHVIPYIANSIGAFPRSWSVGYDGCRPKMFELFLALWSALGFNGNVLVNSESVLAATSGSKSSVSIVDEKDFHERADFFIFEMGSLADDDSDQPAGLRATAEEGYRPIAVEDFSRMLRVHRTFVRAVADEQQRKLLQRRFILINMHNNAMCRTAIWRIGASATPSSTHLTHGFALSNPLIRSATDPVQWLQSRLSNAWPAPRDTIRAIIDGIRGNDATIVLDGLGPVADDLSHILSLSEAAPVLGVSRERLHAVASSIQQNRFSIKARRNVDLDVVDTLPAERGLSRIGAIEDFDDPEWAQWVLRSWGGPPIIDRLLRSRTVWESNHVLYALDKCGALNGTVLLLTHPADEASMSQNLSGRIVDWTGTYAVADITQPFPGDPVYDAVVLSSAATIAAGASGLANVFEAADRALKPQGVGIFICDIGIDIRSREGLTASLLRSGKLNVDLENATGWQLQGPLHFATTANSLDAATADKAGPKPIVNREDSGLIRASCILVYRKQKTTPSSAWDEYRITFSKSAVAV